MSEPTELSADLLAPLARQVTGISDTMSKDEVLEVYDHVRFYLAGLKDIQRQCETAMIKHIKAHGDIEAGNGVRYFVGVTKTTKCTDVPAAVEAVMHATGGDFVRFCDVLASQALKHGACKKVLPPEQYGKLFVVETKEVLDEKGVAVKAEKLVRLDERSL